MTFGLSCTAIGMRPIAECIGIYHQLSKDLDLQFLELAIGTHISVDDVFDIPVSIHNTCLYNHKRILDYINDDIDLQLLCNFCIKNNVLFLSVHPPKVTTDLKLFDARISYIEKFLGIPVFVETLYKSSDLYSSLDTIGTSKILIDISHINIWSKNHKKRTEDQVLYILDNYNVGSIHLSDNNGYRDSHELIESDLWCHKYLDVWNEKYYITWESLPIKYRQYQRLDKMK